MAIRKFEELDSWKKAKELVVAVYGLTKKELFCRDFGLRDQIQRAAVSVMANIAEGFGTFSDSEFIRFLGYSIRSSFEVQSHLHIALELNYISREEFVLSYDQCTDCINLCKGLIRYLREKM